MLQKFKRKDENSERYIFVTKRGKFSIQSQKMGVGKPITLTNAMSSKVIHMNVFRTSREP